MNESLTQLDRGHARAFPVGGITLPPAEETPRRRRRIMVPVLFVALVGGLGLLVVARLPVRVATSTPAKVPARASAPAPRPAPRPVQREAPFNAFMRQGAEAARRGALEEAARLFRQALDLNAAEPEGWNNLGVVLVRQGDLAGGIEAFRRALRLRPTDAEAHRNLGVALDRQGNHEEAVWHYQAFLSLGPEDHPGRAEVRRRLGE